MMTVDVSGLPKGGEMPVSVSGDLEVSAQYNLLNTVVPVSFAGGFSRDGAVYILRGTLKAPSLAYLCDKCLKPLNIPLETEVSEKFSRVPQTEDGEAEDEVWLFSKGEIDLRQVLTTNLLLALPLKTLCGEDCKGLCPVCGKDLNLGACGCVPPVDPRFAGLKTLFQEEEV